MMRFASTAATFAMLCIVAQTDAATVTQSTQVQSAAASSAGATTTPRPSRSADPATPSITVRVPDVTGMLRQKAISTLQAAELVAIDNFLADFDPQLRIGGVQSAQPAAGTAAQRGTAVVINIPRAAIMQGMGVLAVRDVERKVVFDLDVGKFKEVFAGADIVRRKYVNQPTGDTFNVLTGRER